MEHVITVWVESDSEQDTDAFCELIRDMPIYDGPVEVLSITYEDNDA